MPLWYDVQAEQDLVRVELRRRAYYQYLSAIADDLPAFTKEFALSDWYYSDSDRNPHDSWVETVEIREHASGDRRQVRNIQIKVELLTTSHSGRITFRYHNVVSYDLESWGNEPSKHGDWLSDEISLASGGNIVHEVLFSSGVKWRIKCNSISYEYTATEVS
jgi:hypothetical protein